MLLKAITLLFVLFAGSKVFRKFREHSLSLGVFSFAVLILAALLTLVFDPHLSDVIAHALGIQRGADIAFFSAILILIYLVFRLYSKIVILDQDLTALATKVSIERHKQERSEE